MTSHSSPRAFKLASFLLLIASCSTAFCQTAKTTPESDPTGYFQQPYLIADHVHMLRQGAGFHVEVIGNVTVVEQTDGLVLIDAGGSPGAASSNSSTASARSQSRQS